jgi:inorganic phosphate transporter, PiT family
MHFFQSAAEQFGRVPWGQLSAAVWALIGLALLFDFLNGFHDSANSIATVVSTRVLSPQAAVVWAAFFNFIAFLLFHLRVADTIGKDIIAPAVVNNRVIAATLLAACFWDLITWYWGLPTSSSHALIGGLIGAGLATAGADCLRWDGIRKTVLFIFLAPLLGLVMGLAIAVAVAWLFRRATPRRVDTVFRRGQLLSAAFYSLGHGGNDAQKTMGIIFVLLLAFGNANSSFRWEGRYRLTDASLQKLQKGADALPADDLARLAGLKDRPFDTKEAFQAALGEALPAGEAERYGAKVAAAADTAQVPTEVVLACHVAMGVGTLFGGWRIVKTMGQRIIRLRPVDGFCAEAGAAATLALTVFGGVPVSTTHTITGSIVGVGALKRLSAVRWGVAGRVVWAWVLTIPGTALVAAVCWWLLPPLG